MATLIKPDGQEVEIKAKGKRFTLEELQALVGGYIEIVRTKTRGQVMYVNEEGKVHGLPPNTRATALMHEDYAQTDGSIVGNAVLARRDE